MSELATMTAQDVFDHVARHLLTQLERCDEGMGRGSPCLYRGPRGLACAVGALIPQACYVPEMENRDVSGLQKWCMAVPFEPYWRLACFLDQHLPLLYALQKLHDSMSPTDWPRELWNLACHRGLSTDVVDDMMGARYARADSSVASEAAFRTWLDAIVHTHAPRIETKHEHVFV
ncbi:hypothetical protein WK39_27780 [Burkholderia cepacia]|nr:hypothetical protein WK39_27780 [Burkholderia cepacia]KVS65692.1 hypothetical protein WK40_12090 [Burkholderia cepacia]